MLVKKQTVLPYTNEAQFSLALHHYNDLVPNGDIAKLVLQMLSLLLKIIFVRKNSG